MLNYKLNTTQAAHLIINSETKFKNISETYLVNILIFRVTVRSGVEQNSGKHLTVNLKQKHRAYQNLKCKLKECKRYTSRVQTARVRSATGKVNRYRY